MVTEPEDHSTSLSENSNQWTVPFRVILNAFVVLLIFTTGLTIGAVYYFNTVSIVDRISTDFFKVLSKNSIERTQQHFETAQSVNRLNTRLATQGLINPQDYKKLGNHFVQVLRTYPELTIAAYGGQDGMSLLAYRQSSSRIEIHLWEQRDDHTLFRRFRVDDQGDWSLSDPFFDRTTDRRGSVRSSGTSLVSSGRKGKRIHLDSTVSLESAECAGYHPRLSGYR